MVGTALVNMYGKCGHVGDARRVFCRMPNRDVITWNAMIAAEAQNNHGKEALNVYYQMQSAGVKPDKITFVSALDACTSMAASQEGQKVHTAILEMGCEHDVVLGTALVNMYGKLRSTYEATSLFRKMPHRDIGSWNAMISVYAQNGHAEEALNLFHEMQTEKVNPDRITFVCVLDACASQAAFQKGLLIHAAIVDMGFEHDAMVGTALVNMFGKCGSACDAQSVFWRNIRGDVALWTAIIAAVSQNGHCEEALDLFQQMQYAGVKPDAITYVCVLAACSYTGRVDDGQHFFVSMRKDHGIMHTEDHCVCVVDLLSRSGLLDEAEYFINNTPFKRLTLAWLCLLGACRVHHDLARAERVANCCFELNPTDATPYVTLSNIYAATQGGDHAVHVRKVCAEQLGIEANT